MASSGREPEVLEQEANEEEVDTRLNRAIEEKEAGTSERGEEREDTTANGGERETERSHSGGPAQKEEKILATERKKRVPKKRQRPDSAPPPAVGRPKGVKNYSLACVDTLLDLVEELLPLSLPEWVKVGERWNTLAEKERRVLRTPEALRQKFESLYYSSGAKTQPSMARRVQRAKKLGGRLKALRISGRDEGGETGGEEREDGEERKKESGRRERGGDGKERRDARETDGGGGRGKRREREQTREARQQEKRKREEQEEEDDEEREEEEDLSDEFYVPSLDLGEKAVLPSPLSAFSFSGSDDSSRPLSSYTKRKAPHRGHVSLSHTSPSLLTPLATTKTFQKKKRPITEPLSNGKGGEEDGFPPSAASLSHKEPLSSSSSLPPAIQRHHQRRERGGENPSSDPLLFLQDRQEELETSVRWNSEDIKRAKAAIKENTGSVQKIERKTRESVEEFRQVAASMEVKSKKTQRSVLRHAEELQKIREDVRKNSEQLEELRDDLRMLEHRVTTGFAALRALMLRSLPPREEKRGRNGEQER